MATESIVADLRSHGLAIIPPLSPDEVLRVLAYMDLCPVYPDAHMPETARKRGDGQVPRSAVTSDRFCMSLDDAITAPILFERAMSLFSVAQAYLEVPVPLSYSSNAFWTRPGKDPHPDIQEFHRDADDTRFLALFCYLTDVLEPADGAHVLQSPNGEALTVLGPAGTLFLADTSNPHRGIKPLRGERGIWWWRWGVSDPPESYKWDKNAPIPAARLGTRYPAFNPALRESLRLLVTP